MGKQHLPININYELATEKSTQTYLATHNITYSYTIQLYNLQH